MRGALLEQQRARSLVLGETPAVETVPATVAESTAPAVAATPPQQQPFPHAVEPGESLVFLALRFGVSMEALRAANPSLDINRARPGTVITVPPPVPGSGQPTPLMSSAGNPAITTVASTSVPMARTGL